MCEYIGALPSTSFAKLTNKRLKHGVFRSLRELKDAIHRSLDHINANPKPFKLDEGPKQNHRHRQTRAPSVRPDRLASLTVRCTCFLPQLISLTD
jgi:hypothetical protein